MVNFYIIYVSVSKRYLYYIIAIYILLLLPCAFYCFYNDYIKEYRQNQYIENLLILLTKSGVAWFPLMIMFYEKDVKNKLFKIEAINTEPEKNIIVKKNYDKTKKVDEIEQV